MATPGQTGFHRTIPSAGPADTAALACALAPALRPGDTVLLSGPIGAGKTHFARALITARLERAGRAEDVPSPTFTLVQTYSDDRAEIWHADLYRLGDPDELAELGLAEAFETAICLVEWPDRLGPYRPPGALELDFALLEEPGERRIVIASDAATWSARLAPALEAEGVDLAG